MELSARVLLGEYCGSAHQLVKKAKVLGLFCRVVLDSALVRKLRPIFVGVRHGDYECDVSVAVTKVEDRELWSYQYDSRRAGAYR